MSYSCGTMTILNGAAVSSSVAARPHFNHAKAIMIAAPAALTQANATVQSSHDNETTWNNHQSAGADITIAQGDTATITVLGPTHFRVNTTGGNETGAKIFTVRAVEGSLF